MFHYANYYQGKDSLSSSLAKVNSLQSEGLSKVEPLICLVLTSSRRHLGNWSGLIRVIVLGLPYKIYANEYKIYANILTWSRDYMHISLNLSLKKLYFKYPLMCFPLNCDTFIGPSGKVCLLVRGLFLCGRRSRNL